MIADFRIEVWDGCATEVATAIQAFCDRWKPYSAKSSSHSIFSLFESLIDPAFARYLSSLPENHGGRRIFPNISISRLARLGGFRLAEEVIHGTLLKFMQEGGRYDFEFERTLETLLEVTRRCESKQPKTRSGEANRLYSEHCEFCGRKTELAALNSDSQLRSRRENGARLSEKYCQEHRPKFFNGSRNPDYIRHLRHRNDFEIEVERLTLQTKALSAPHAETGDLYLDLFYFKLLAPLPIVQSDIGFVRNMARQIIDSRVSDKKKRIVVMRADGYTLAAISEAVGAKNRQAIAKALATVPKMFRFDLKNATIDRLNIATLELFADIGQQSKEHPSAYAHFMALVGPATATAIQDPDVSEIMLNDDGALWSESASSGMKRLDFISALNATKIVHFAAKNFSSERETSEEIISVLLPFASARFTAFLPPVVERPIFSIRKRRPLTSA
jgi:hypothetical protein